MKRLLIFCICVTLSLASVGYCGESSPYDIYVINPPINNYAIQEHKPLPITCKLSTTISMMACRGEYEPASFVVETDKTLKNVLVTIGELTTQSGAIIASNAVDVRVAVSSWVRITDTPGRMNWVLLHDPGLLVIDHEKHEDPYTEGMKFTRTPIDTLTLQSADVATRQQFWLTVHVPDDAVSGTYTGEISITAKNAPTQTLTLNLEVPDFDLLEPNFQYSLYHATRYHSDLLRLNEFKNMVAHGCMNPNIYDAGVDLEADGKTLNFSRFATHLSLREESGMKAAGPLYIVNGTPVHGGDGDGASMAQVTTWVKQIIAWARQRGYADLYFMGNDEGSGQKVLDQRPTWEAVRKGGGKMFVANYGGFFPYAGDILDLAVILHPLGFSVDTTTSNMTPDDYLKYAPTSEGITHCTDYIMTRHYQNMISDVHRNGSKIFTYMDSLAGKPIPDIQRRLRGLGLYKAKLDGTMTWSYNGSGFPPNLKAGPVIWNNFHSFVLRGAEAPFDTLNWEAYREGYDDARYLATLQNAIVQCSRATGERLERVTLLAKAYNWLATIDVNNGDLDTIRRKMARLITTLQDVGGKERTLEEILTGIDWKQIQIQTFPEPWQFKIDSENEGVKQKLFSPNLDDSLWAKIRTDKNIGWDKQGFDGKQSVGFGWYRAYLPRGENEQDRKFNYLYFEAVDEDAWVYLNGVEIFEHSVRTTGLTPSQLYLAPFSVPLIDMKLSDRDLLAVRVHSICCMGGIWKPVHLIQSDHDLTQIQLHALIKLRTEHKQ